MSTYQSVKIIDGFSTCFRQWKAIDTHCSQLHGYAISFELTFEGKLDHRNWTYDYGGFKRATHQIGGLNPSDWFKYMFDHTTIIAADDPFLSQFQELANSDVMNIRILPAVGCELFAQFVFETVNQFLFLETSGRVSLAQVKCIENQKNSAIYKL